MATRMLVTGWTWDDDGVCLRAWIDGHSREHALSGRLCFRILAGQHCVGRHDGVAWRPCPRRAAARRGGRCDRCFTTDAFRPCMTCTGFRCPRLPPAMEAYCRGDHHLYLASFGGDVVKVGTASHARRNQRVVEQGPLAAVHIARGPGPTIKQMEHQLVEAGFTEAMRRSRKTVLVQGSMTPAEATQRVLKAAAGVWDTLAPIYHPYLHETPTEVPQHPLATRSRGIGVNALRVEDDRVVEGEIVGAVGHLVFLDDDDGRFALDLGALKGRWIELDPPGPRRRAEAQLGLF